MPSRVRAAIRSASNSATIDSVVNRSLPTGSTRSYPDPFLLSFTPLAVNSSAISRASGTDWANRSSLATTRVSRSGDQLTEHSSRPSLTRLRPSLARKVSSPVGLGLRLCAIPFQLPTSMPGWMVYGQSRLTRRRLPSPG
jgi:hypothetical protein